MTKITTRQTDLLERCSLVILGIHLRFQCALSLGKRKTEHYLCYISIVTFLLLCLSLLGAWVIRRGRRSQLRKHRVTDMRI